ncbi:hypothetical protein, partial [Salmonella sp. s55004]|uniref:hypothetical protein n=1 Tax=Salmonella sp. s55004 TaxID=3159675 RepID=UPI003980F62C
FLTVYLLLLTEIKATIIMNSKTLYILLLISVTISLTLAVYNEDEEFGLFEEMEKRRRARGRKSSWVECEDRPGCTCYYNKHGELLARGSCAQSNAHKVGL